MHRICFSPKPKVGFTSIRSHARVQYNSDEEKKVDTEANDNIQQLVVDESRIWTSKKLKVFFYLPEKKEMEREEMTYDDYRYNVGMVLSIAGKWSPHTDIKFEETMYKNESDVRVAFGHASEWSVGGFTKELAMCASPIPVCSAVGATMGGPVGFGVGLGLGYVASFVLCNKQDRGQGVVDFYKKDLSKLKAGAWAYIGGPQPKTLEVTVRLSFPCFHKPYKKLTESFKKQFDGTVLHEFGHVLGFEHENMGEIPYDVEAIKKYYRETHKWNDKQIDRNVLSEIDASKTLKRYGPYDPDSIMSYAVHEQVLDKKATNWRKYIHGYNWRLSENDKKMARRIYGVK